MVINALVNDTLEYSKTHPAIDPILESVGLKRQQVRPDRHQQTRLQVSLMDNLDNRTPIQPNTNDLQAQCDALRHLVVSILILVIVISGTLNIYLLRQWRTVSKDLAGIRPQAAQMFAEYQRVSGPRTDFVKKIKAYGLTHPDFAPILAKYGIKPAGPTGAPPATTIAPAAYRTPEEVVPPLEQISSMPGLNGVELENAALALIIGRTMTAAKHSSRESDQSFNHRILGRGLTGNELLFHTQGLRPARKGTFLASHSMPAISATFAGTSTRPSPGHPAFGPADARCTSRLRARCSRA